jgi:hypothetical protein
MTAFCRTIAGRGLQPLVSPFPGALSASDDQFPGAAEAGLRVKSDGTFEFITTGGAFTSTSYTTPAPNQWLASPSGLAGQGWYVRVSEITGGSGGAFDSGPSVGAWVAVIDEPVWTRQAISSAGILFTLQFSSDPAGPVAASTTCSLFASGGNP